MVTNDEKQLARQRRERKFHRRLTTLSWTLPVFAFGSFFSIWHNISSAVNPSVKTHPSVSVATNHLKTNAIPSIKTQSTKSASPAVLFKIGSKGSQVSAIQEQLYELGYFNHVITENYGSVTAHAVESFQTAQHLNATGEIDSATLAALQKAAKDHQTSSLVSSSTSSAPETSNSKPAVSQNSSPAVSAVSARHTTSKARSSAAKNTTTRSAAVSQQSTSQTSSSAS